jgi:exopolysaccharide production protein ExoZ
LRAALSVEHGDNSKTIFMADHNNRATCASPRLEQVQFLRFLAAMLVVCGHILLEGKEKSLLTEYYFIAYKFRWGWGVDIFFVISGFIMLYISRTATPGAAAAKTFLARRAMRIVPLYWTFTALMVAALLVAPGPVSGPEWRPWHLLSSFLFIPSPRSGDGALRPILSHGWTLNYEVLFYFCFATCLLFTRRHALLLTGGVLACIAGMAHMLPGSTVMAFYKNTVVIEFLYGGLLYHLHWRGFRIGGLACMIAVGASAVLVALGPADPGQTRFLHWGLPAFAVCASIILYRGPSQAFFARPAFQSIGDASYALYLSHPFVYHLLLLGLRPLPHEMASAIYVPVALLACLAVAVMVHRLYERPLHEMLRGIRTLRRGAHPSTA